MTAAEFWEERFKELPQNESEKLAVAMMTEYADYVYAKFIKATCGICKDCKYYWLKNGLESCHKHNKALCMMFGMADDEIAKNIGCQQFDSKLTD